MGRLGRNEKRARGVPCALSIFSIIAIFIGYLAGASAEERVQDAHLPKISNSGQMTKRLDPSQI